MFLVGRGFVDALFIGDTRRLARGSRRWRRSRGGARRAVSGRTPRSGAARTRGALAPRASQAQRARPRRARAPCRLSRARTRRRRSIPSGARLFPPTSRARAPRTFATRARPLGRPHRSTPARARRRRAAPPFPPTPLPARPAHAPPAPPSFSQVGRDLRPGAVDGPLAKRRTPDAREPGRPGARRALAPGRRPRGALLSPDRAAEFTQYACVHPPHHPARLVPRRGDAPPSPRRELTRTPRAPSPRVGLPLPRSSPPGRVVSPSPISPPPSPSHTHTHLIYPHTLSDMGNGYVSRTSRRIVETVRERVSTDVVEMLPVRGGGVVGGSPGDGEWLSRQLAAEVHNKFEDMVRRSPNPTRAERTSYEELVAGFPGSRGGGGGGRLALPGANADPDSGRSPRGDAAAAGFGSPPGLQTEPNRTERTNHTAATRAQNDSDLFTNLSSPPPSFRAANGGASGGANDGGVSLDDLILRRRGPPPDPDELRGTSGNFGRGFGRGSPLGGGAIFSPPTSAGRDTGTRAAPSPLEKLATAAEARRPRAAAVAAGAVAAAAPRALLGGWATATRTTTGTRSARFVRGSRSPGSGGAARRRSWPSTRRGCSPRPPRRGAPPPRSKTKSPPPLSSRGSGARRNRGAGIPRRRIPTRPVVQGTRSTGDPRGSRRPLGAVSGAGGDPGGRFGSAPDWRRLRRRGDPGDRRGGTATARGPVEGRSGAFEHSGEGEGRVGAANAAHGGGRVGHGGRLG